MVEGGQLWLVTNVPGQEEVRSSRQNGEQCNFAVLGAGAVTVLSLHVSWLPQDQHFFEAVVLCVE